MRARRALGNAAGRMQKAAAALAPLRAHRSGVAHSGGALSHRWSGSPIQM